MAGQVYNHNSVKLVSLLSQPSRSYISQALVSEADLGITTKEGSCLAPCSLCVACNLPAPEIICGRLSLSSASGTCVPTCAPHELPLLICPLRTPLQKLSENLPYILSYHNTSRHQPEQLPAISFCYQAITDCDFNCSGEQPDCDQDVWLWNRLWLPSADWSYNIQ